MSPGARGLAKRIFAIIAEAESKAHGVPPEQVHFHEVGAIDSIIDIASFAVLYDSLGVDGACIPRLAEGTGTVRCQHGVLPIPVPAVAHIAAAHGLDLAMTGVEGELVTPTGAAIAAAIRTSVAPPPSYRIVASGLGAGKRDYACAGFLRAMLVEPAASANGGDRVCKLECNIDDATGEELGFAMERLLEAGAKDVFYTPVFMKKNRPGWMLGVICAPEDSDALASLVFRHTTTLGIRKLLLERSVLDREIHDAETPWGPVPVKTVTVDGARRVHPEYDSVARIARENGLALREVARSAAAGVN